MENFKRLNKTRLEELTGLFSLSLKHGPLKYSDVLNAVSSAKGICAADVRNYVMTQLANHPKEVKIKEDAGKNICSYLDENREITLIYVSGQSPDYIVKSNRPHVSRPRINIPLQTPLLETKPLNPLYPRDKFSYRKVRSNYSKGVMRKR